MVADSAGLLAAIGAIIINKNENIIIEIIGVIVIIT